MHLLMVGALYASVISFILLLHEYINYLFPDQLNFFYHGILSNIRYSTATLIVIFPVYLFSSWLLGRDFLKNPQLKEFRLRKWLIYLTLFIAAIAIISSLVGLVFNFLSGELSARFLLKVLAVFVTTGAAFGYYLADVRDKINPSVNKIIAWLASLIIVIAITAGFFIVGSPFYQRQVRLDEQRVSDLQIIQNEITNYWFNKEKLPANLADLKDDIRGFIPPVDPEYGESYVYEISGPLSFKLCAVFKNKTPESSINLINKNAPRPVTVDVYYDSYQQNWSHEAGDFCFSRTIDPELYSKEKF